MNSLSGLKSLSILWRIKRDKRIKVLRMDNGGEFHGNVFEELCKKFNIER
jgi:hypothetical protein